MKLFEICYWWIFGLFVKFLSFRVFVSFCVLGGFGKGFFSSGGYDVDYGEGFFDVD